MKNIIYSFYLLIFSFSFLHSQNLFPLEIGNQWIYERIRISNPPGGGYTYDTSLVKLTVVEDSIYNDKSYKVLQSSDNNSTWLPEIELWRIDDSKLSIVYDIPTEQIYFDNAIDKDTSLYDAYITLEQVSLWGKSINVQKWLRRYFNIGSITVKKDIAPDIGLIRNYYWTQDMMWSTQYIDNIKGAVINGIVYGDTTVTSIRKENNFVNNFDVEQNYPNPFNITTTIKYRLYKNSEVLIKIYDLTGREISTLVSENQNSGEYRITFNAQNLASGIYIYKIKVNSAERSRKMLLIR